MKKHKNLFITNKNFNVVEKEEKEKEKDVSSE